MVLHHWLGNKTKTGGQSYSPKQRDLVTAYPLRLDKHLLQSQCDQLTSRMKLNLDELKQVVSRLVHNEFEGRPTNPYSANLKQVATTADARFDQEQTAEALSAIDDMLGLSAFSESMTTEPRTVIIPNWLDVLIGKLCHSLGENVASWLRERLDDPKQRLPGALWSSEWLAGHFSELHREARQGQERLAIDIEMKKIFYRLSGRKLLASVDDSETDPTLSPRLLLGDYYELGLRLLALAGSLRIITGIQSRLELFGREMSGFRNGTQQIIEGLEESQQSSQLTDHLEPAEDILGVTKPAVDYLKKHCVSLCAELDHNLQADLTERREPLHHLLTEQHDGCRELARELMFNSRGVIRSVAARNQMLPSLLKSTNSVNEFVQRLAKCAEAAKPELMKYGGGKRSLLASPDRMTCEAFAEILTDQFSESVSAIECGESGFVLCYEVQDLPADAVALQLIEHRADYHGYAAQLHTRVDVDWQPLFSSSQSDLALV